MNNKPIQLRIEEARKEVVSSINEIAQKQDLDFYFLHSIIKELFVELNNNKEMELVQLENEYNKKEVKE
jgi:hypothetical protein